MLDEERRMKTQSVTATKQPRTEQTGHAPTWRTAARWTLCFAALTLVLWLLRRTGLALVPFALGLLLAYLLFPIVSRLDRWLPRWASVVVVYLVGLLLLGLGLRFRVPPIGA